MLKITVFFSTKETRSSRWWIPSIMFRHMTPILVLDTHVFTSPCRSSTNSGKRK